MRIKFLHICLWILSGIFCASAQNYSVDWYKISGGGGTSSNGNYSVTGTIGQPDASLQPMTGGNYSLTGGFWSLISLVQTPGLPNLIVMYSGNSIIVSWPDPNMNSYTLQQNSNLSNTGGWGTASYPVSWVNGTNSITITPPSGNLFFRLKQ